MRRNRIFSTRFPGQPHFRQNSVMSANSSTGTPMNQRQRSEYDLDELECMEQLGSQPGDIDSDNGQQLDKLRQSLTSKKKKETMIQDKKKKQKEEPEEPVDQFTNDMKNELYQYKSDLSRETNVENLIAHLSQRYLAKYAAHDPKATMTSEMQQFSEQNPDFDLKTQLDVVRHQIAMELFKISKVVDDGNFHVILQKNAE